MRAGLCGWQLQDKALNKLLSMEAPAAASVCRLHAATGLMQHRRVRYPTPSCVCCAGPPCCSDFSITTDDDGLPGVKFTVPSTIKQNPGGLKRSRGAQLLDQNPDIFIYAHPDPFLDGASILRDDDVYRQAVERDKAKDKPLCDKLFLQLKHKNGPAAPKVRPAGTR